MNCALHKTLPLQYFCQTCLDPICSQCIKSNPHSNEFHQILSIQQAVQNRKQLFDNYVQNQVNPLRQRIRQKLQELKQVQTRQFQRRNVILKDIMLEFQAIDHRTKQKSEKKTLEYQTEIKYYQSYLNSLDDLAYTFDKTASDPYNLLILYQDFTNQLKSLQLKEIKERIDNFQIANQLCNFSQTNGKLPQEQPQINSNKHLQLQHLQQSLNLPRQIKTTFQQVSKLQSLRQRNQLLNGVIATACQNYQTQRKKALANNTIKFKNKLHVFNEANNKIIQLNVCKSCAFCGLTFTLDTANDQCGQNKSVKTGLHDKYSHLTIDIQFRGTKRHYWVDSSLGSRKVPDLNAHQMLRPSLKKGFMNSLNDLYIVKCCFRKYQIDHLTVDNDKKTATIKSFMTVFQKADKQNKGILSKITFKYILTKTFEMNEIHGDILTELFSYNWQSIEEKKVIKQGEKPAEEKKVPEKLESIDGVNYRLLKNFMQHPLFPHEQWQKIQQEGDKSKPHAPKSEDKGLYKYGIRR